MYRIQNGGRLVWKFCWIQVRKIKGKARLLMNESVFIEFLWIFPLLFSSIMSTSQLVNELMNEKIHWDSMNSMKSSFYSGYECKDMNENWIEKSLRCLLPKYIHTITESFHLSWRNLESPKTEVNSPLLVPFHISIFIYCRMWFTRKAKNNWIRFSRLLTFILHSGETRVQQLPFLIIKGKETFRTATSKFESF